MAVKEHDRLLLAREQMQRKLKGRRSNSRLPQLMEMVLRSPVISSQMVEKELQVTQQGALKLISELNLREITGRGRFRAWGVFSQFSYTCCEGGQRRAEIRCGERRWIAKPEPATGNCFALIANDAQFRSTCDPSLDSHFGQQCNSHSEIDELHQCHDGCGVNITACLRWGGSYSSQDVFTKAMPSFQQKKWLALQIICINPVAIGQCMIASHRQIEDIPSNLCCREFIEFIGVGNECDIQRPGTQAVEQRARKAFANGQLQLGKGFNSRRQNFR